MTQAPRTIGNTVLPITPTLDLSPANDSSDGTILDGIRFDTRAPEDLKVLSWPPNKLLADVRAYAYLASDSVARKVNVYVIDNGLDPSFPVGNLPPRVESY